MITEYLCYKIRCEKCGHSWVTKTHEIPVRCAKCNSVKWNEGCPPMMPKIIEPAQPIADEPKDALAVFIAKAQAKKGITVGAVSYAPEPVEEVWQFTKDKVWYDEMNTPQRKQWLVGSKATFRIVEVNEFDYDVIERVSKGKA